MQSPKSCTDQERDVRAGLHRQGISTEGAIVINDEAESGTKTFRDEFARLDAMMRAGEISILAVDDQSRLTRADNAYAFITDLVYAGGRFISTGEGLDTTQQGWQLRVKVMELHNSQTIEELGRRVRRGQTGRLLANLTAGDYPMGYESFLVRPEQASAGGRGPKPEKDIRIKDSEARWIRQIFAWFVAGWSISAIARDLRRLNAPRTWNSQWNAHHVRRILSNEKYVGHWVWGTTRTIRNSAGKKKQIPVPREQWIVRDRLDLGIIDQETWEKTIERLRELHDVYGKRPEQKKRGPRVHHTVLYPTGLLPGLIFCSKCKSRLWYRSSGKRVYLGCPNSGHGEAMCPMTTMVSIEHGETQLLQFLECLLNSWPAWLQEANSATRTVIEEASHVIPAQMAEDQLQFDKLQATVTNLVDQLADGSFDSPAVRGRLREAEDQLELVRKRIDAANKMLDNPIEMPSDEWIANQLKDLTGVLREANPQSARLLRRLLGKVWADHVVLPGKRRGYARLRLRIDGLAVLLTALGTKLSATTLAQIKRVVGDQGQSDELILDFGGPSRMDYWAPIIAEKRSQRVPWKVIWEITGLGSGPAYVAWKRYVDAQAKREPEHRNIAQEPSTDGDVGGEAA